MVVKEKTRVKILSWQSKQIDVFLFFKCLSFKNKYLLR